MKKQILATTLSGLLLVGSSFAANDNAKTTTQSKVNQDDISYILGYIFGERMKTSDLEINYKQFESGLTTAMQGKKSRFTQQEMREKFTQFQTETRERLQKKMQMLGAENQKRSEKFLAENKGKPGVVALDNGLQYKVITKGNGASPSVDDTVKVEYQGNLMNGEKFDASQPGKPIALTLRNTIQGWQQLIPKMKVGGVWELYIPAKFAYGLRGVPGKIGPNEALVFKVTLVSIDKK